MIVDQLNARYPNVSCEMLPEWKGHLPDHVMCVAGITVDMHTLKVWQPHGEPVGRSGNNWIFDSSKNTYTLEESHGDHELANHPKSTGDIGQPTAVGAAYGGVADPATDTAGANWFKRWAKANAEQADAIENGKAQDPAKSHIHSYGLADPGENSSSPSALSRAEQEQAFQVGRVLGLKCILELITANHPHESEIPVCVASSGGYQKGLLYYEQHIHPSHGDNPNQEDFVRAPKKGDSK